MAGPGRKAAKTAKKVAEKAAEYDIDPKQLTSAELAKTMNRLEDKMYEAAKNLEFEQAAHYRDQLEKLKHSGL